MTSIRWQKWVTETGHIITVTGQTQKLPVFTNTRAVLTELYTQVPSPSRTGGRGGGSTQKERSPNYDVLKRT